MVETDDFLGMFIPVLLVSANKPCGIILVPVAAAHACIM